MDFVRPYFLIGGVALLTGLAGRAVGQTNIPDAFQKATCSTYVSGQSWLILSCGPTGFVSVVGKDAATNTVKEMATVSDFTMMGKKPIETYTESIFLIDTVNNHAYLGFGTFDSYAAVVKVQNSCGQTGFVAGTIINAQLTTNDYVGGAVYLVPHSFHSDEVSAEKAAAALSADDPGETGDYPPNMSPNLTLPSQPNPNTFLPGKYIPGPNAPADHAQRAADCYTAYRAACRTAFTNYKNALANARSLLLNGAASGATVGGVAGAGAGLIGTGIVCVFLGPPGWAAGLGIVTVSATVGGAAGAVAGPSISVAESKQAALLIFKNDSDSARAAYIKCLEAAGYVRNPYF